MTIAQEIARRINALEFAEFPTDAIAWAKVAIMDTIGVALAGAQEEATRISQKVLGVANNPGPSLIWGRHVRTLPLEAALINGTAAHALDFDDCHDTMGGHPSAPVVSAVLALGDGMGFSGRDLIEAFIAGYETETRIAAGVHHAHYLKGWHPTATLGVFGATAASARLLKLTEEQLATALSLCVSLASGVKANFGTMTKPLHVGLAARNGLFAALMAREGFTANAAAFEHKQGFFEVFNAPGAYDAEKILADWADPLQILEPGVAIKQFPCCGGTHSAADAVLRLRQEHALTPDRIEKIESRTHDWRYRHTNRPDPNSALDAKFSVQYVMARALVEGRLRLEHFEGDAYKDPDVRALLQRIESTPHDDDDDRYSAYVTITLKDGTVLEQYVARAKGRGPAQALTAGELKAKFVACAQRALPADDIEALYESCQTLETLNDVRALIRIMETPAPASQAAE